MLTNPRDTTKPHLSQARTRRGYSNRRLLCQLSVPTCPASLSTRCLLPAKPLQQRGARYMRVVPAADDEDTQRSSLPMQLTAPDRRSVWTWWRDAKPLSWREQCADAPFP